MRLITISRPAKTESPSQSTAASYEGNQGKPCGSWKGAVPPQRRLVVSPVDRSLPRDQLPGLLPTEQRVDLRHYLESVGDVEHVGFAARPSAVGIEIDGAALANETPADSVGLLTMTAGGQTPVM